MAASGSELRLGKRFGVPPGTANGGYACGRLAALVGGGTALVGPGGEVLAAARTLWLTLVRPPGPA
jgi:hypothetical protein